MSQASKPDEQGQLPEADAEECVTILRSLVRRIHDADQAHDLRAVLEYIFTAFRAVIPYDRIGCAFLTADGRKVYTHWTRSELGPLKLPNGYTRILEGSSLARLLESDEPRIIPDLETYLAKNPSSDATRRIVAEGGRSSLTCPFRVEGEPIGFLFFASRHPHRYTSLHQAILQIVADEIGAMIEGARLREQYGVEQATRKALNDAVPASIALLHADGTVLEVNKQWCQFARDNGYATSDLGVGRNYLKVCDAADDPSARATAQAIRSMLAGERDRFSEEYACHSPTEERWCQVTVNRVPLTSGDHPVVRALVMHVDVTERVRAERQLAEAAYRDPLTGLLTRLGLTEGLNERLAAGGDDPAGFLVVLDIANLTGLNEVRGYAAGDQFLAEVARRLREALGDEALIGRVGAGKFGVFVPVSHERGAAAQRAAVAGVFHEPFEVGGVRLMIGARFGYTRAGRAAQQATELLREAEVALSQARATPNVSWQQYTSELARALRAKVDLTQQLRDALANAEFELHYQPKVDLSTGQVLGAEALLRWQSPRDGLVSPATFIPIAERSQLILPIGDWVLHEACRCLRGWMDEGWDIVRVAVNVSVTQLTAGNLPNKVRTALADHGLNGDALTLEITESVFGEHSEVLDAQLQELRAMGVQLSLDDFGTGYSSLLYLQQHLFDEIKVDKGFVQQMLADPYSHEIVAIIIGVAGVLGATVVAEGVETPAERDALIALGCTTGQGFHYSRPLAEADFRGVLESHTTLPLPEAT